MKRGRAAEQSHLLCWVGLLESCRRDELEDSRLSILLIRWRRRRPQSETQRFNVRGSRDEGQHTPTSRVCDGMSTALLAEELLSDSGAAQTVDDWKHCRWREKRWPRWQRWAL